MKRVGWMSMVLLLAALASSAAWGGPVTRISALSPRYNSGEIEVSWETPLTGGCTTSNFATTNATAQNHQALIAFLLAAFSSDTSVEVVFGGGCASGANWIQTVKLVKS
jgi:hypothetical protein